MISLPLHPVLNLFASRISVYDLVGERVAGRWQQTAEPERSISGVIQPADERALSLLPEGDRSSGALLIHTHARLSWCDVEQGATSNRQTLVRYDGSLWRVVNSARLAGIWRYLAIRYVNNDPDHP